MPRPLHSSQLALLMLVGLGVGCPAPQAKQAPVVHQSGAELAVTPPAHVLLQFAIDETKAENYGSALKAVEQIFQAGERDHLEAWILAATLADRQQHTRLSKEAWKQVEELVRRKGKTTPFTDPITLFAAGMHYLTQNDGDSAALFVDELIRRFPKHAYSPLAQARVVDTAIAAGHWRTAANGCELLQRRWPGRAQRCARLQLRARRLVQLGPSVAEDAPRWSWETPLPQGNSLHAVWVAADGATYAVGDRGAIVFRSKGSDAFVQMPSPTRWNLRAVSGNANGLVVAAGEGGVVLRLDGKRWVALREAKPGQADLHGVTVSASGQIVAVGDGGVVWDGKRAQATKRDLFAVVSGEAEGELWAAGATGTLVNYRQSKWHTVKTEAEEDFLGLAVFSEGRVRAVGTGRALLRMDGNRQDLRPVGKYDLHDVWGTSADHFWMVGKTGTAIEFSAKRWHYRATPTLVDLFSVSGTKRSGPIAVGQGGTTLQRKKTTWKLLSGGQRAPMVALHFTASGEPVALDQLGGVWTRENGRWRRRWSAPAGRYQALAVLPRGYLLVGERTIFVDLKLRRSRALGHPIGELLLAVSHHAGMTLAVGHRGGAYVLEGQAFKRIGSPTGLSLTALSQRDGETLVVGRRGTILHLRQTKWQKEESYALGDLSAVQLHADRRAIAVGQSGLVLLREQGRWRSLSKPAEQNLVGIWGKNADDFHAVSENGGIYYYRRGAWQVQRSPAACLTGIAGNAASQERLAFGCFSSVLHPLAHERY